MSTRPNLSIFPESGSALPLVNFNLRNPDSSIKPQQKNVFISNPQFIDMSLQAASIERLSTLGLITIDFDHSLTEDSLYKPFYQTSLYQTLSTAFIGGHMEIEKGVVFLNSFGQMFVQVCLH